MLSQYMNKITVPHCCWRKNVPLVQLCYSCNAEKNDFKNVNVNLNRKKNDDLNNVYYIIFFERLRNE